MEIRPTFEDTPPATLPVRLSALLFARGEETPLRQLAEILEIDEGTLAEALPEVRRSVTAAGLTLIENDGALSLRTSPAVSSDIEKAVATEEHQPLTKAALETLSIITYYGPVSKAKIEQIRGVNSGFILRSLMIRGLVIKASREQGGTGYLYVPSAELLAHLGISSAAELPEYASFRKELASFIEGQAAPEALEPEPDELE